jgi:hypothetical protein
VTFLAPMWLVAAAAVSGVVVVLHFFARRQPAELVLPTARFVPPHSAQSTTRTLRPNDLLLMLLRIAIVLAAGAALAKPMLEPRRQSRAGIVLADVSRATPSLEELRRRVAAARKEGDVVIPFDSGPHEPMRDSIATLSRARGSLSSAMIAALDAARAQGARADSVELTIVSAVREEELDRATPLIRALWPGRITIDRLPSEEVVGSRAVIDVRAEASDPLSAAARVHLGSQAGASSSRSAGRIPQSLREVRLVRDRLTTADSAWVQSAARVLVFWPANVTTVSGAKPDTGSALVSEGVVVVAPLVRFMAPVPGKVIVRWADGQPAATEVAAGRGCIRSVAVSIPSAGDLVLRPEFGRLLGALTGPCDGAVPSVAASDSFVTSLAGAGPLASGRGFPAPVQHSSLAPWLLALALLLVLVEPFVRRGAGRA